MRISRVQAGVEHLTIISKPINPCSSSSPNHLTTTHEEQTEQQNSRVARCMIITINLIQEVWLTEIDRRTSWPFLADVELATLLTNWLLFSPSLKASDEDLMKIHEIEMMELATRKRRLSITSMVIKTLVPNADLGPVSGDKWLVGWIAGWLVAWLVCWINC